MRMKTLARYPIVSFLALFIEMPLTMDSWHHIDCTHRLPNRGARYEIAENVCGPDVNARNEIAGGMLSDSPGESAFSSTRFSS